MNIGKIPVAILAGGLATRLRPITETIPKVLVPVAGKPFLSHQLELLRRQGVRRVVMCLGHLGALVEDQYGDGSEYGLQMDYSFDGPKLLGTGGALRTALPKLGDRFFVMYGDSYLPTPFGPVADFFEGSSKSGLMTVYRNQNRYDKSNVHYRNGEIMAHDKNVITPEMEHIDYGLSLFKARAFQSAPETGPFELTALLQSLLHAKDLAGYEMRERFYEIGSHEGLADLETMLAATGSPSKTA